MPSPVAVLRAALGAALDLLSPPSCAACDCPLLGAGVFCAACGDTARVGCTRWYGDLALIGHAGWYEPPLSTALQRFKYAGRSDLGARLGLLLRLEDLPPAPWTWVPVPAHPRRLAERGFNPPALVATHLAQRLGGEVEHVLRRVTLTTQQSRLGRSERQHNLSGAFRCEGRPRGTPILVDDVVTTGATLLECAHALQESGAARPFAVALAVTAPPST